MSSLHPLVQPSHRVVTIGPHAGIVEAWRMMRDQDVEYLVVTEGGTVLGVLSAKDLMLKGVAEPGQLPSDREVLDIVEPLPTLLTDRSDLAEAMALMRDGGVSAVPLLRHGTVVGLLTADDLLEVAAACMNDTGPAKRAEEESYAVFSDPLVRNLMEMLDLAGI